MGCLSGGMPALSAVEAWCRGCVSGSNTGCGEVLARTSWHSGGGVVETVLRSEDSAGVGAGQGVLTIDRAVPLSPLRSTFVAAAVVGSLLAKT
jgi:hypothetical protein